MKTVVSAAAPQVVIVGAGPFGLSLAAHLQEAGIFFRIFGRPMLSWMTQMPAGMKLKSDGFASNLSAGSTPFTLEDFCKLTGREYDHTQIPVAVEDFADYGLEFARRFVPNLEESEVTSIEPVGDGYRVTVATGESILTRHVVLATGVSLFQDIPSKFAHLPKDMVTHTSDHRLFDQFAGRDVVVLGRGASSLNAAALLNEVGARPTVITRKSKIYIHKLEPPQNRPLHQRLRHPGSPLGNSLRSWFCCVAPGLFRALPSSLRRLLIYKHLGPAGGAALEGRVEGKLPILLGSSIVSTVLLDAKDPSERRIRITLTNGAFEKHELITSHIIAGTGFRVDLSRINFLSQSLRTQIRVEKNGSPRLKPNFESNVKGLYFIGPASAASFGPYLRFIAGAEYSSRRVTQHLLRELDR